MDLSGISAGNRYTIEREIGSGGMATVWLATDTQHHRRVAIKTLHPELTGAMGTDRFLREIRVTAQLQHPGILPILDSGLLPLPNGEHVPWYAMPYLEGESLRDRLNREVQLPIDESLRITRDVGRALESAHQRNIVHRDIKPENIFLTGDQVFVVDFGIARALAAGDTERLTSTGLAIGTPAYMSPEQAMAGLVDARSDQYSLATMLYEMIAGEPPFSGPNPQATLARRLAEPARALSTVRSTVPPAVERATLRALERAPADRFPSIAAFLASLDAPEARAASVKARPRLKWVGAGIAVAVIGLAAWSLRPREQRVDPEIIAMYERGLQAYDRRTPAGVNEAITTLRAVIQRDSAYAPAWNALAKSYARAYQRGFRVPEVAPEQLLQLGVAAVDRALALDSMNADSWTSQAVLNYQIDPTSLEAPLRSLRRALALDSNRAPTWHYFAIMTADNGELPAALDAWRRSVRSDPRYSQGLAFLALGHYWHGDYDSAAVWADSAIRVDPSYMLGQQTVSLVAIERGRFEEALDHGEAAARLSAEVEAVNAAANLALVRARWGPRNMAEAQLLGAEVLSSHFEPLPAHTAIFLAEVHAALGDAAGAIRALGRYGVPRDRHFQLHLRCSPTFAPVEKDPRFRATLTTPRPEPGQHC